MTIPPTLKHGRRAARGARLCLASAVLSALPGCAGGGRVTVAALDYRNIDPPPARVAQIDLQSCYWWTDESGQVWIAAQRDVPSILGPRFRQQFCLSLVVSRLPAGGARDYHVRDRELRAWVRAGPLEARYTSSAGVLALYRNRDGTLRGSFRIETSRQVNALITGWTRPARCLVLGEFRAVPGAGPGRRIAALTEADGFERPPTATVTSRPAGAPAPGPASAPPAPR